MILSLRLKRFTAAGRHLQSFYNERRAIFEQHGSKRIRREFFQALSVLLMAMPPRATPCRRKRHVERPTGSTVERRFRREDDSHL